MTDPPPSRLPGLDGLRGLAALVVALYHSSRIAAPALSPTGADVYRVIADSPAKIVFAGTEAVLVFFALSGLVVALPAFRSGFGWIGYYGARLVRLFLPVWAALLLATVLIVAVPRDAGAVTSGSWLATTNAREVHWDRLLAEASLWPAVYRFDNVLWSLIAIRVEELRAWGARRSRWFWRGAVLIAAGLLISGWLARPIAAADSEAGKALWGAAAAGAVGLVICAAASPGLARLLSGRVPAWFGRVSFSLYLVHVPVLATLAFAWGESAWPAVLAVGIPASLILAELFTRLVERPSHRLAQRVRGALTRGAGARRAAPSPIAR